MYQEIYQQPAILQTLLDKEMASVYALAQVIQQQNISHIVIAARGSSDNAGRYAKYLLGAMNQYPVSLATPSLFTIYQAPPTFKNT
ncbi:MAG: glucosamine--fructose-6-phosphate aminotransferase, partial [Chloroflexota bacterium]